jgi:hypothetical protein
MGNMLFCKIEREDNGRKRSVSYWNEHSSRFGDNHFTVGSAAFGGYGNYKGQIKKLND